MQPNQIKITTLTVNDKKKMIVEYICDFGRVLLYHKNPIYTAERARAYTLQTLKILHIQVIFLTAIANSQLSRTIALNSNNQHVTRTLEIESNRIQNSGAFISFKCSTQLK